MKGKKKKKSQLNSVFEGQFRVNMQARKSPYNIMVAIVKNLAQVVCLLGWVYSRSVQLLASKVDRKDASMVVISAAMPFNPSFLSVSRETLAIGSLARFMSDVNIQVQLTRVFNDDLVDAFAHDDRMVQFSRFYSLEGCNSARAATICSLLVIV